jgi:hypothetical protein
MNSEEIRLSILKKGVSQTAKEIELQIKEKAGINNALFIFVFCVGFLFGMFTMYFIEK